jgi:hypothetical protein
MHIKFLSVNLKGIDHAEEQGIDEKIFCVLKK